MIGFDIGGTKCAVVIGQETDGKLTIVNKQVIPTDLTRSPYEIIDTLCAMAEEMTDDLSRIGISCGGPLDDIKGIIQSPPNLPGWDDIPIVDYLQTKYGGKAALQNDANACALAEWQYGAGQGTRNMIFLTFGSGLGAGLILNGQLYSGTNGMAGEVGHLRMAPDGPIGYGKPGSFEGFCSGGGIARTGQAIAQKALAEGKTVSFCSGAEQLPNITAREIARCADEGDPVAIEVYAECGRKLGAGLAMLMDILNPQRIVIGSIFARSQNLLEPTMKQVILQEALPHCRSVCQVVPAALGEHIGDYAALTVARMIDKED